MKLLDMLRAKKDDEIMEQVNVYRSIVDLLKKASPTKADVEALDAAMKELGLSEENITLLAEVLDLHDRYTTMAARADEHRTALSESQDKLLALREEERRISAEIVSVYERAESIAAAVRQCENLDNQADVLAKNFPELFDGNAAPTTANWKAKERVVMQAKSFSGL